MFGGGYALNAPQPRKTTKRSQAITPLHGNHWLQPRPRVGIRPSKLVNSSHSHNGASMTMQKLLELVKVRRAAGRVGDLDVAEANYQLSEAQSQLVVAQGLYSEARRNLELLIGRYPAAELAVAKRFLLCRLRSQTDCLRRCWRDAPTSFPRNTGCWPRSEPRRLRSWPCCLASR